VTKPPKKILTVDQLLKRNSELRNTLDQSQQLLRIEQWVHQVLPSAVRVARFDAGTLHLICPDAALATQVRYRQQELIQQLQQHLGSLHQLQISVRPDFKPPPPETVERPEISARNRELLSQTASIIDHPQLSKALKKLAKNSD